jgi:NAD(P)-dependent dehydrogenase (short-subunit alcohol dehydrogenase family)
MSVALVTGANRGIGLELTRQLIAAGGRVLAVCRQSSDELKASGASIIEGVELTEPSGIERLVAAVNEPIDRLINNAGLLSKESLDELDLGAIRRQFEINAVAPLAVTHALLERLAPAAKVAVITSRMGSLADNTSGSRYGYRMSKAAANMMAVSLSRDLAPRGIAVAILHPGFVRTGMTGFNGYIDPQEAAEGLLARLEEAIAGEEPVFRHANGTLLPW